MPYGIYYLDPAEIIPIMPIAPPIQPLTCQFCSASNVVLTCLECGQQILCPEIQRGALACQMGQPATFFPTEFQPAQYQVVRQTTHHESALYLNLIPAGNLANQPRIPYPHPQRSREGAHYSSSPRHAVQTRPLYPSPYYSRAMPQYGIAPNQLPAPVPRQRLRRVSNPPVLQPAPQRQPHPPAFPLDQTAANLASHSTAALSQQPSTSGGSRYRNPASCSTAAGGLLSAANQPDSNLADFGLGIQCLDTYMKMEMAPISPIQATPSPVEIGETDESDLNNLPDTNNERGLSNTDITEMNHDIDNNNSHSKNESANYLASD